jgi:hypothetical protein
MPAWNRIGGSELRCGNVFEEVTMGRALLLWIIGIPIPIILLVWLLGGFH